MFYYWILWSVDVCVEMLLLFYLMIGIKDGSIHKKNISSWLVLLCIPISVLVLALVFKNENHLCLAKVVLSCVAVPVALIGAMVTYISSEELSQKA